MRILFFSLIFASLPLLALAQEGERINARLLPTIWFSKLEAKAGEEVKIFAAIQNDSGINFSGEVVFYVDSIELEKVSFNSQSGTLKTASADWKATEGSHNFRAEIKVQLPEGKTLLSEEARGEFDIKREITFNEVKEEVQEKSTRVAEKALDTVVEKIDQVANALADKVETTQNGNEPRILGSAIGPQGSATAGMYEAGTNFLSLLLREWKWTLTSLLILIIIWKMSFR